MEGKILNIIPENLRKDLIKEVVSLIKENPNFLEENNIVDKKDIYEDIQKWASKNSENKK